MKKILLWPLAMLLVLPTFAQRKKGDEKPAGAEMPKKAGIAEKTKACKKYDGLFPMFQDTTNGSLYFIVKKEHLTKTFIYFSYTENGVVDAGHFRGSFRDNKVFTIRKYFDKVEFVVQNTSFYFDPQSELSKSAQANISPAVLVSQKVVAENAETGDMLLDGNSIFLTEALHQVKPSPAPPPFNSPALLGMLSREKTKLLQVRNYEKNTDIRVEYVYDNPSPTVGGGREVTDERAISIVLQHSLIEAPEVPMKSRADDARVGFFGDQVNDMTTTNAVNYKDVIHRWRLEKKDKNAALSEPVKPITWWIEKTTPKELRETIKAAGLQWNLAFEKAGFKNAVEVKEQPDDADWDAGDIRYNVLRWTSSPQPPFGGYGPSFVDPRTGEILGADIMLEYIFVTNRIKQERLFAAKAQGYDETPMVSPDKHFCDADEHLHMSTMFGMQALEAQGLSDLDKREYLRQSLYYLVMHEMGHTMGLMHNMKATQLWNPVQAHDKKLTQAIGLVGSVMDYPAANIALDKTKQGDYFTTRPGPYDLWAIEYGYSEGLEDEQKERERLQKILSRSADSTLMFGNDADDMRSSSNGIDPRVNVNDFSNDAITYSVDRIRLINQTLPKLKEKYIKEGSTYQELVQAYSISMGEWFNAATTVTRYVGGVYVDRAVAGQKGATRPLTPVDLKDQKRAMAALNTYIFSPNAFAAPADLYQYLQVQRRGFNFFGTNEDPKLHDRFVIMQINALAHLTNGKVLKRMTDSRLYGNKYSVYDMFSDLTEYCFRDDMAGTVNTIRQNLQLEYTRRLITVAGIQEGSNSNFDPISKSAAMSQLKKIRGLMAIALVTSTGETKAHREHVALLIDKAFAK